MYIFRPTAGTTTHGDVLCGQMSKKRLRIAWEEHLASVKILVRLKAPYVSRKNADNQHILMSVRYHVTNMKMKYLTEIELNAFWCGDLAAATLCGSTIR